MHSILLCICFKRPAAFDSEIYFQPPDYSGKRPTQIKWSFVRHDNFDQKDLDKLSQ